MLLLLLFQKPGEYYLLIILCAILGMLVLGLAGALLYTLYQLQQLRKRKDPYSVAPKAFLSLGSDANNTLHGDMVGGTRHNDPLTSYG